MNHKPWFTFGGRCRNGGWSGSQSPIILHCVINQFSWLQWPLPPLPHTPRLPLNPKQLTNISSDPLKCFPMLDASSSLGLPWCRCNCLTSVAKVGTQILSSPWREEYTEPIFCLPLTPRRSTNTNGRFFNPTILKSRRCDSQTNSRTSGSR